MAVTSLRWDIFCAVIDNFGDIGICWRLSRQLAAEHHIHVRLWVDDLASFQRICPQIDTNLQQQSVEGVTVMLWSTDTDWSQQSMSAVVIEALACTIPLPYQQRMAAEDVKPLWLNLEYLSAEDWVEGCHALPSPQPQLALEKYFFFPGFTGNTGGLLQERTLQQQAAQFSQDASAQQAFWHQLGIDNNDQYQQKISLFAYDHPKLETLLQCWQQAPVSTLCLVPQGMLALQLAQRYPQLAQQADITLGQLRLKILPFVAQAEYDKLLWACDINFVRGEDSIIRAHWAAKPFIWQIYRQEQQAHLEKLQAFMQRYCAFMPPAVAKALQQFWLDWNSDADLSASWPGFAKILPQIGEHNQDWRSALTANGDLASNLVHFVEKKFIMRRNFS